MDGTDTAGASFGPTGHGMAVSDAAQICQSPSISIDQLLASRGDLLRAHRKATCWLFFKEVGVRSAATRGAEETLLACRICRPQISDVHSWEAVRGARGGLVRYSSTTGTSAMRTHVRNVHREEAELVDRALSYSPSQDRPDNPLTGTIPSPQSATLVHSPDHESMRKRPASTLTSAHPHVSATKRRREDVKTDILLSIQGIEAAMAGLYAAVESLKTKVQTFI